MSEAWPEELRLAENGARLVLRFDNDESHSLSAELLRVASPSAEVKGHAPDQAVTVAGKRHVKILRLLPVGNYAVRIVFDDGHDTGLYTWTYLLKRGREQDQIWGAYLDALNKAFGTSFENDDAIRALAVTHIAEKSGADSLTGRARCKTDGDETTVVRQVQSSLSHV